MTLIELLVVLLILSILVVVAVQSTDVLLDQARWDGTQRTLQNIEEAILGPTNQRQSDGSLLISGFVADMGRLPVVKTAPPEGMELEELWVNAGGSKLYGLYPAPFDAQILVASGWRGPYLRFSPGTSTLRDGWGRPFDLAVVGTPATMTIGSLGADKVAGGTGYNLDTGIAITPDRYLAVVAGNVKWLNTTMMPPTITNPDSTKGPIVVKLYGPDPAVSSGVSESAATVVIETDGSVTFSAATTIGPRVLRAYQGDTNNPATLKRSQILRIVIPPGGGPVPDLIMQ